MPTSISASISSVVATGRRMKISEKPVDILAPRRGRLRLHQRARLQPRLAVGDDLLPGLESRRDGGLLRVLMGDLDRLRRNLVVVADDVDEQPVDSMLDRRGRHNDGVLVDA